MAKRIRVKVTAQDIKRGVKSSCRRCPLAVAIGRDLDTFVSVGIETVRLGDDYRTVHLSRIAQRFIDQFDTGRKVKPHTFYLTLPLPYLERGANG